ncbi:MAG: EutN/CcmL family microcompartment protein [Armatimonadetes bacterium]|nr:EutN/CcmL family microcompartment protein [Armatimonadota bacterium]
MIAGKILGTVVCTQKEEKLIGFKFQILQPLDLNTLKPEGKPIISLDTVGAGKDELVIAVAGSSARQTAKTTDKPTDSTIVGIIDTIELKDKIVYQKYPH